MEGTQRDSTQDWVVPRGTVPTVGQLETRIDEAVVIARASEEGVREVGEIALDAARQARRAAEMAEESARAAQEAARGSSGPAGPVTDLVPPSLSGWSPKSAPPPGSGAGEAPAPEDGEAPQEEKQPTREVVIDPLQRFNARADAVAARLRKLEGVPA
ncbi:MAG TPA: hypothetical protein VD761_10800 [Solirubrobacterales bacterium]|nr:hypothetical protein [Solirubrobacterales bacterium]